MAVLYYVTRAHTFPGTSVLGGRLGGGGDDGADDGASAVVGLGVQLADASSSWVVVVHGRLVSFGTRVVVPVAWSCSCSCLWQQLGADDGAIGEFRNAERCEREKVGSGGIYACVRGERENGRLERESVGLFKNEKKARPLIVIGGGGKKACVHSFCTANAKRQQWWRD